MHMNFMATMKRSGISSTCAFHQAIGVIISTDLRARTSTVSPQNVVFLEQWISGCCSVLSRNGDCVITILRTFQKQEMFRTIVIFSLHVMCSRTGFTQDSVTCFSKARSSVNRCVGTGVGNGTDYPGPTCERAQKDAKVNRCKCRERPIENAFLQGPEFCASPLSMNSGRRFRSWFTSSIIYKAGCKSV